MRHCDHALAVDLDDPVADADSAAFSDAAAKETADLKKEKTKLNFWLSWKTKNKKFNLKA